MEVFRMVPVPRRGLILNDFEKNALSLTLLSKTTNDENTTRLESGIIRGECKEERSAD